MLWLSRPSKFYHERIRRHGDELSHVVLRMGCLVCHKRMVCPGRADGHTVREQSNTYFVGTIAIE